MVGQSAFADSRGSLPSFDEVEDRDATATAYFDRGVRNRVCICGGVSGCVSANRCGHESRPAGGPPASAILFFPDKLLTIERYREAATLIMLVVIGYLAGQRKRDRIVSFLWAFAFWDMFYYLWLRVTIGWPGSLSDTDLLFLLPVPWVAQVWFPVLVSGLTILVIGWRAQGGRRSEA
jgi:hypothetical protein